MSVLSELEAQIGIPKAKWTKANWQHAALQLAATIDGAKPKRGRPKHTSEFLKVKADGSRFISQADNYAALAFRVKEMLAKALSDGEKLTLKGAVRRAILEAIKTHNDVEPEFRGGNKQPVRKSRADNLVDTAYRKLRDEFKK